MSKNMFCATQKEKKKKKCVDWAYNSVSMV